MFEVPNNQTNLFPFVRNIMWSCGQLKGELESFKTYGKMDSEKKTHKTAGKRFAIKLFPHSSKRTIVSTFRYNFIDLYKCRSVVLHSYWNNVCTISVVSYSICLDFEIPTRLVFSCSFLPYLDQPRLETVLNKLFLLGNYLKTTNTT